MWRGDNQRVAISQVVRDFLTAVVRVIPLSADLGESADDFRKVNLPGQCSIGTPLNNLCMFCVHDFSFMA
jgi:hypothetical protein